MTRSLSRASLLFVASASLVVLACTSGSSTPAACTYDGKSYASGSHFPSSDGCNSCSCDNGSVMCTLLACFDGGPDGGITCVYDGVIHHPGDTFPSTDGCNTCGCDATGTVGCTARACADDAGGG